MKMLIKEGYIHAFDSGVIVIMHWLLHNKIRKDRRHETQCLNEKGCLIVQENRPYVMVGNQMTTNEHPDDSHKAPEVSEEKVNKGKVSENSIEESDPDNDSNKEYEREFDQIWKEYPNKKGRKDALKLYIKAREHGTTYEEIKAGIEAYSEYIHVRKQEDYVKYGSTFFRQEAWKDDWSTDSTGHINSDDGLDLLFGGGD